MVDFYDLYFSMRASGVLKRNGIDSLEKLVNLSSRDMIEWENCGKKTINEIRHVLRENGFSLKDETIDPNVKQEILENIPGVLDGIRKQVEEAIKELRYFSFKLECIAKEAKNHKE